MMTESYLPLTLCSVSFDIDGKQLIKDCSLSMENPGLTVILGHNGAGKSILLKLLHGLITPTVGSIRWGLGASQNPLKPRQAMVFQKPVLLRRTVGQNLDFVLKLPANRKIKTDRNALLEMVGLLDRQNQSARSLSGGEQQRLALVRALASRPDILFLDEATASLDPVSVSIIEDIVKSQCRNGTKIFFVTHDLNQAERLGDDVIFMDRGRLLEHGMAKTFFSSPGTPEARAYLNGDVNFYRQSEFESAHQG